MKRGKPKERNGDEITINVALHRSLHRRVSLTCAVRGETLREAVIDGLRRYAEAHASELLEAIEDVARANDET